MRVTAKALFVWTSVLLFACVDKPGLPFRLDAETCDNLLDVHTTAVSVDSLDGPSRAQILRDTLNPSEADLSQYFLRLAVEQDYENLLNRAVVIEGIDATFTDPASGATHQGTFEFDEPIELGPRETRMLTFFVLIPGDSFSIDYLVALIDGAAFGMTIVPNVRVTVPESDNCGFPDGMVVRAKEGTVEVKRPVRTNFDGIALLVEGLLKALAHGG